MDDITTPEPWYRDDQGESIVFKEASASATMTVTVTHQQFQSVIDCAGRGCTSWADRLKINRLDFQVREWRTVIGRARDEEDRYTYHWHIITPRKLVDAIVRVCKGEAFEYLDYDAATDIRNLWLAPPPEMNTGGLCIDDEMANALVQIIAFGEVRYG